MFCGVLRLCQDNPPLNLVDNSLDEVHYSQDFIGTSDPDHSFKELHNEIHGSKDNFRARKDLATLWASVQAELLAYRRLTDDQDWISQNFSMKQLQNQLESGQPLAVNYVQQGLLKTHCICGSFDGYPLATLSDATDHDIANLDVWERANYGVLTDE